MLDLEGMDRVLVFMFVNELTCQTLCSLICRLDTLDTVYRGHKMALDTAQKDIEEAQTNISTCKQSTGGLEERYRFFQEMRGYVRDLVECLNEKVGHHFVWEGLMSGVG